MANSAQGTTKYIFSFLILLILGWAGPLSSWAATCSPAWNGTVLINCDALDNWVVEHNLGASGGLETAVGIIDGQAIQLNWDIGTGDWVQGKYTFPAPQDLSAADIFGITLQGGGPAETANQISVMFADVNNVFYGIDLEGNTNGINNFC